MSTPAADRRPVRLVDGAWAVSRPTGVWVGVLDGGFASGWHSHVGLLPVAGLDSVQRVLSAGGQVAGDSVSVAADDDSTTIQVAAAAAVRLDLEGAARLQVLCSMPPGSTCPGTARVSPATTLAEGLPVRASRGAIEVDVEVDALIGSAVGGISAAEPGLVAVEVIPVEAEGTTPLHLPALPVLLAAAEADRDGGPVALNLRGSDGTVLSAELPALAAARAAADAQWLLPTLLRRALSTKAGRH